MKTQYRLKALDHFTCLAADCPASCCCAGWNISLEPDTYRNWATLPDHEERTRLLDAVVIEAGGTDKRLRMATGENGCCRLLSDKAMCSVQERHGEDWMPAVCRSYPRATLETATHTVATATLSCPDIARRILFSPDPGGVFHKSASGQTPPAQGEERIRYLLTELLDRVMAETKFPVAVRVYYLADMITRLSRLSIRGELSPATLDRAAAGCKGDLFRIGVAIKERQLRPDPRVAGSFWHTLARIGQGTGLLPDSETPRLADAPAALPSERAGQYTATYARINQLRATAQPLLRSYEPHFNRYLHASLLYNGFPQQPALGNYIVSLMRTLVPFSLARLRLWLLAEKRSALSDADVVDAVYGAERRITHSKRVLDILDANPELLELDRYHSTFVDL